MSERQEYSPQPAEGFLLTDTERLFDRVSHARFKALVFHPQTIIHRVELSSNDYGEFLFVTASRSKGGSREVLTFYGLGFHEQRDRWIKDEWFWYRSESSIASQQLSASRVEETIQKREREIQEYADKEPTQSRRGQLFETLADVSDEDGASSMLDEIEGIGDEDL